MLQREHSAILSTFIKLPIVIKIFVLSIFEWPFYTDFTVCFNLKIFKMSPRVICMMLYMDSIVDQTGHFAYAFAHVSVAYSYDVVTIL